MLTGFLILVVVAIEIDTTFLERTAVTSLSNLIDRIGAGGAYDLAEFDAAFANVDRLARPSLAAFIAALVAFATWLSVVVGNIPGLGDGEPSVTRMGTFIWAVIPVVNLRRIPKIVQEVLYRLDPRAVGMFMVGLAWVGLVGSWILARIVGLYLDTRLNFDAVNATSVEAFAQSSRQLVEWSFDVDVVTTAMITSGAFMLVVIIAQVERRAAPETTRSRRHSAPCPSSRPRRSASAHGGGARSPRPRRRAVRSEHPSFPG
jgi:hypothetical protein